MPASLMPMRIETKRSAPELQRQIAAVPAKKLAHILSGWSASSAASTGRDVRGVIPVLMHELSNALRPVSPNRLPTSA